jgi:hypothetical protein
MYYNLTFRRFRAAIVPVENKYLYSVFCVLFVCKCELPPGVNPIAVIYIYHITYSEYVFVDLGIRHAMRKRHIVTCGLPASAVLFHIIS